MGYCQLHGNHLKTHSIALYLQVLRGSLLKRGNKISAGRSLFPVISLNMAGIWDVRVTLCVSLWTSKYTHYMIIKAIHPPPKALANAFNVQPPILLLTHITFYCNFCKLSNLLYFGGISIRASVTFSHTWTKNETFSGINNLEAGKSPPFISLTFSVRPAAIRVSFAFRAQHKAPLVSRIEWKWGSAQVTEKWTPVSEEWALYTTLLISERSRTMAEQHLIRVAELQQSVSMGTGYYVPALSKHEVYVWELCLQRSVWLCWPGRHL